MSPPAGAVSWRGRGRFPRARGARIVISPNGRSEAYAPFFVAGSDSAGLRYRQPAPTLLNHTVFYQIDPTDFDPAVHLASLFQPRRQSILGADGVMRETEFLKYAGPGKPTIIRDPNGHLTWLKYDTHGNLTHTINALGEGTETEYDTQGRVIATYRATGTGGSESALPAVTRGVQLSATSYYAATDPEADKSVGRVKTTTDAAGVTTRYTYWPDGTSAAGQAKAVSREWTDGHGAHSVRDSLTEYDAAGRAWKVMDAHGRVTTTHYDAAGRAAVTVDAYGGKTVSTYDARGQVIRTLYPDGTETRTSYDALGRAEWTSDRFVSTTTATVGVNAATNVATVGYVNDTTTTALATRTLYDTLGRAGGTERYKSALIKLETDGPLLKSVGPDVPSLLSAGRRLSVTGTAYDDQGRVSETKDAAGLSTQTEYYVNGQVKRTRTVADGVASPWTVYDYDRTDNLPAGTVSYDSVTDANNHTTKTYKDALGRVVRTAYADESFTETLYGVGGQLVPGYDTGLAIPPGGSQTVSIAQRKAGDPAVATVRVSDKSGRLTDVYLPAVIDATATDDPATPAVDERLKRPHWQYAYDVNGNQISQIDPKGHTTYFDYDDLNRRTARWLPMATGRDTTTLADDMGVERWHYDAFGRVDLHTDFNGNVETYTYAPTTDLANHIIAGQLQQVVYAGAPGSGKPTQTVGYTYDELGRRKTVTDASGTTTYIYDALGNVSEEVTPEGTIHYAYDPTTGRHIGTWTGTDALHPVTSTTYHYDGRSRLDTVTVGALSGVPLTNPLVTHYTYDDVGDKKTETLPTGEVTTYGYDDLNRLTSVSEVQGTSTLFTQTYVLNADGTRKSSDESQQQPNGSTVSWHTAWTYDDDGRLTGETVTSAGTPSRNYADTFGYDLAGNRATQSHVAGGSTETVAYTYDASDELKTETGTLNNAPEYQTGYDYDPNGSQTLVTRTGTNAGVDTYGYDVRNKMTSVTNANGTATYVYDDAGNRVKETAGGTTTLYLTDHANPTGYAQPVEEKASATALPAETYLIGDRVFGQANATNAVRYLLTDGHGSTMALTGGTGVIQQAYAYTAFGGAVGFVTSTAGTMFLFGGDAVYDPASGLYLHGDGTRGRQGFRFIERDPPGYGSNSDPISMHTYLYAGANPIAYSDPNGHEFNLTGLLGTLGLNQNFEGKKNGIATQAVRRTVRSKQFDVYVGLSRGGLSQGSAVFVPHAFLYVASKAVGAGQVFDVGENGLRVHSENLQYERSNSIFLYRFAEFTAFQYAEWSTSAYVISALTKNDKGLPTSTTTYWDDIQLAFSFTFVSQTVNCYKFTLLAGLDALATARLPI